MVFSLTITIHPLKHFDLISEFIILLKLPKSFSIKILTIIEISDQTDSLTNRSNFHLFEQF